MTLFNDLFSAALVFAAIHESTTMNAGNPTVWDHIDFHCMDKTFINTMDVNGNQNCFVFLEFYCIIFLLCRSYIANILRQSLLF